MLSWLLIDLLLFTCCWFFFQWFFRFSFRQQFQKFLNRNFSIFETFATIFYFLCSFPVPCTYLLDFIVSFNYLIIIRIIFFMIQSTQNHIRRMRKTRLCQHLGHHSTINTILKCIEKMRWNDSKIDTCKCLRNIFCIVFILV